MTQLDTKTAAAILKSSAQCNAVANEAMLRVVELMQAARVHTDRIAELEAALTRIDAINDNPARFSVEINDVILAALPDHVGNRQ